MKRQKEEEMYFLQQKEKEMQAQNKNFESKNPENYEQNKINQN